MKSKEKKLKELRKKGILKSYLSPIHHVCQQCGELCSIDNKIIENIPSKILASIDYSHYEIDGYCQLCIDESKEEMQYCYSVDEIGEINRKRED